MSENITLELTKEQIEAIYNWGLVNQSWGSMSYGDKELLTYFEEMLAKLNKWR